MPHCYEDRFRPYYDDEKDRVVEEAVAAFPRIIANLPRRMTFFDTNDPDGEGVFRNLNQVPIASLTAAQRTSIETDIAAGRDTTSTIGSLRPFPQFDAVTFSQNAAQSTYHSAQAKVEKRFGAGPMLLASYTFGKSIDNASDFGSGDPSELVLNARSLANQRALSSFDVKHRFSGAFTYDLPLGQIWQSGPRRLVEGWQLNGVVTASCRRYEPLRNHQATQCGARKGLPRSSVTDRSPAIVRQPQ